MFSSFSAFINVISGILFFTAPLVIQLVLFPIAKLCIKNTPSHELYTACLIINTILLFILKEGYLNSVDNNEPFDAFDGLIITIIWSPFYIANLISCIVRNVKASESDKAKEINDNIDDNELNSDL